MTEQKIHHLSDDHLLRSVIAETELTVEMRTHLSSCPRCLQARRRIEQDLGQIGKFAKRYAPKPRRRPLAQAAINQQPRLFLRRWAFSPLIAAAATVMIITGSVVVDKVRDQRLQTTLYEEMLEDEAFMTEISNLEENALPRFYVDISNGSVDPDSEEGTEEDAGRKPPKGDAVS